MAEHAPWMNLGVIEGVRKIGRIGAWAPGNYLCQCHVCKGDFIGDKRAICCLPCELHRLAEAEAKLARAIPPERELAILLLSVLDADKDHPRAEISWARRLFDETEDGEHYGDCTKAPITCNRCVCDDYKLMARALLPLLAARAWADGEPK